jgi:hypothetical protein
MTTEEEIKQLSQDEKKEIMKRLEKKISDRAFYFIILLTMSVWVFGAGFLKGFDTGIEMAKSMEEFKSMRSK